MRAIVVDESMWGHTERLARAIAAGLTEHLEATVLEVAAAPTPSPTTSP